MIRPVFTEIVLFVAPFVLYAVFLWATKAGVMDLEILAAVARRWLPSPRWCWCSAASSISRISPARRPARPTCRRIWKTANSCRGPTK